MRQAKYRKVLWVILLAELALLHVGVLLRLYVLRWEYPQVRRLALLFPIWAAGTLLLLLWQLGSYQRFRRKAIAAMKPVEEGWIHSACEQAASEVELSKGARSLSERCGDDADDFGVSYSDYVTPGYPLQLCGASDGFSARMYPCEKAGSLVQADFHSGKLYLLGSNRRSGF